MKLSVKAKKQSRSERQIFMKNLLIYLKDYKKEFLAFLKYANGKILMSENYHQAYPQDIMNKNRSFIEEINDFLLSQNLIPIGGRDNHDKDFFKQLSS